MGAEVKEVVKPLTDGLDKLKVRWRKVRWIGRDGCPDLIIFLPGRVVWVEAKAPKKKPRPNQTEELLQLSHAGQTCIVADSTQHVEEILAFVATHLRMAAAQHPGAVR